MLSGFRVHRSCVHTSTNRAVAIGHSAKDKGKRKLGARDLVVPTVCFGANAAAPIAAGGGGARLVGSPRTGPPHSLVHPIIAHSPLPSPL